MVTSEKVRIGYASVMVDHRNGKDVAVCRNCGSILLHLKEWAAETGYYYCSIACAKEDIDKSKEMLKEVSK